MSPRSVYLQNQELYVANVGDVQAMLIQSDGTHKMLSKKHDPAEPSERARIRTPADGCQETAG